MFLAWDDDVPESEEENPAFQMNDMHVAALGTSQIRMRAGQKVKRGDLVESADDDTARVQSDNAIRSNTLGEITASITIKALSDGSFLVPAVLILRLTVSTKSALDESQPVRQILTTLHPCARRPTLTGVFDFEKQGRGRCNLFFLLVERH